MAVLKRDWMGSELADFEHALLFDADKRHWGWCRWPEGGGGQVFTLSKSRFLGEVGVPVFYMLPEGFEGPPSEGQFVQVETDGLPRPGGDYPDRYVVYHVNKVRTVSDRELIDILPRPRLYIDEFRAQVTINFDNARQDNLDLVLPLQLVSSPTNEAGKGGLTIRRQSFLERTDGGFASTGHREIVRQFKSGVLEEIPSGFREVNPEYIYKVISPSGEKGVASLMKKVREVNLMTDPGTSLKIHMPLIHLQSRYRFRQPLSSDVVSYQLTALICQPHLRRQDIKPIESSIRKARKRMERLSVDLQMTPLAEVKIAEAFARMRLVQNNAIYRFLGDASKLLETQRRATEDLYEDYWSSQVEAFADLRSAFDGVEIKDIKVGGRKRSMSISSFDSSLSRRDISVYVEVRRLMQAAGEQYVKRQELKKSLGMDDASLLESLETLRTRGYIIMLQNGTLIKVFDLGEFSGRFDEALPR
jgi:biotin operon repressor